MQQRGGYLHRESLEMVDRLKALWSEVLNEVLTAQTGEKTVWGQKQGCLDHSGKAESRKKYEHQSHEQGVIVL